jgi:hypothetical protein
MRDRLPKRAKRVGPEIALRASFVILLILKGSLLLIRDCGPGIEVEFRLAVPRDRRIRRRSGRQTTVALVLGQNRESGVTGRTSLQPRFTALRPRENATGPGHGLKTQE